MTAGHVIVDDAGGSAPRLVMVHGMSQDHRVFSAQVQAFRDRYRLLLIDLPGHGLSADIEGPYGHLDMAGHVAAAITAAGALPCHYWGTHTGTSLAMILAANAPAHFRSLVLEGPVPPGRPMATVDRALAQVREIARNHGMAEARRAWFEDSEWFQALRDDAIACRAAEHRAIVEDFAGANWLSPLAPWPIAPVEDRLAAAAPPILFYNGERDVADFHATADRLERIWPRARRAVIPKAGGFPAWEYPEAVNAVVAEFLASLADG